MFFNNCIDNNLVEWTFPYLPVEVVSVFDISTINLGVWNFYEITLIFWLQLILIISDVVISHMLDCEMLQISLFRGGLDGARAFMTMLCSLAAGPTSQ